MRPIIILLVFGIALNSCNLGNFKKITPEPSEYTLQNCYNLSDFIQANWKVHKTDRLYKCNPSFIPKLKTEFADCISTLSKKELIDLFGVPSEDFKDGYLNYYVSSDCTSNSSGICKFLSFVYDTETDRIVTFMEWSRQKIE